MPSIFNHENSCWGVRRSFCNVFQYDYNEELQNGKLTSLGISHDSNNLAPSNSSAHYSVSSNGYYGYQPHAYLKNQTTDDSAMDVEENAVLSAVPTGNPSMLSCKAFVSDPEQHIHHSRRKRHMTVDSLDETKRMRQDDAVEVSPKPSLPDSHQCGGGSSEVQRRSRSWSSSEDLLEMSCETTTTQLLRQTHGCEVYLYERSCDY